VTNFYDKSPRPVEELASPESALAAIQLFLHSARRPAAIDQGEPAAALIPGEFVLEIRSGRLWIEFCCGARSIARRILSVERGSAASIECTVQRFGGKTGILTLLDLDRPQSAPKILAGSRRNFAERFRQMLSRQFPDWEMKTLSSAMDLQRSFSPVFPRAHLRRGNRHLAAIACPAPRDEPALLTFALIWLAYIRSRLKAETQISLAIFLPESAGALTAHRLRWLRTDLLGASIFCFNDHGSAGQVDPADLGNLKTRISPKYFRPNGAGEPPPQIIQQTAASPSEEWLEQRVRAHLSAIDPSLLASPVHNQVLAFAGGDRDIIDLLAVDLHGRLAVLELKTAEDVHLPVQALDYWMRIRWHAEREEFGHLFPGISLDRTPPKLYLIAPAICFHSSSATVLRYFSPEIAVERVGLNADWPDRLKVMLRLQGAAVPQSHGNFI
jgi:hypothetical protein